MNRRTSASVLDTLALDDGDDNIDLLKAVETSFGVTFASEPTNWFTLGDIHAGLLGRLQSTESVGRCATSMAFYRLRAALTTTQARRSVTLNTRVADLTPLRPKRLMQELATGLGLRGLPRHLPGRLGVLGLLVLVAGLLSIFLIAAVPRLWPTLLLIPFGVALVRMDLGSWGTVTVGGLARSLAARNFSAFASEGADARPEAVWRALVNLVADELDLDAARLAPETRILA